MRQLWLCVAIVIILLSSCNSASTDTPTGLATDQPSVSIVRSPTKTATAPPATIKPTSLPTVTEPPKPPAATPSPTLTPSIIATDVEDCFYASKFIEDITLQDGSILSTGQQVVKIWRVRNTGTCSWNEGTSIIHIKANRFDSPGKVAIPVTQPGAQVDIHLTFTTPPTSGTYESFWRLENSKGDLFGGVLYIRFKTSSSIKSDVSVPPSATPEPPHTPTATPTNTPTPLTTPTSSSVQEPTVTPILDCGEYNPQFMGVLSQASLLGLDVGCAMGNLHSSTGTVQEFWFNFDSQDAKERLRSLLLKNDIAETTYVIVGKDTLTYEASVAVYEGAITATDGAIVCGSPPPPEGYFIPQNCFTKVWCDNQYWKTAGWPRLKEATADLVMQTTEKGVLIRVSALPTSVYYLALDLETKRGTVQMGP